MRRVLLVALLCVAPAAARAQPPELDETTEETTAGVETARETTAGVETAGESTTAEETEARLREQAGRLAMQRGELEEARADFARAFARGVGEFLELRREIRIGTVEALGHHGLAKRTGR